jgi:beta-galactosidase/beta-glucuronidase
VQDVRVLADPATGRVRLGIELASDLPAEREIGVRTAIHERSGSVVAEAVARRLVGPSSASLSLTLTVPQPGWWSPESPETYQWRVSLNACGDDDGLNDAVGGHFGFRTVELCDGLFHLNGQPCRLKGALLQPT